MDFSACYWVSRLFVYKAYYCIKVTPNLRDPSIFQQTNGGIFVSQEKYALDLLKKFNMLNCNVVATPMNTCEKLYMNDGTTKANEKWFRIIIGGMMYLTHTRPQYYVSS